jgi:hypothetical protein
LAFVHEAVWPCEKNERVQTAKKNPGNENNCRLGRPRIRWEDEVELDLGSRSEEWMKIQNEKIWEDRARWTRLCLVTHYSGSTSRKKTLRETFTNDMIVRAICK